MTACSDLYKKWKTEPNFCGLGKDEANYIDKYIDFVDDFSKEFGIAEEVVYRNAPRTAVKPILRFDKKSDVRKKVTAAIADTLKSKHAISTKFVNLEIGLPAVPKKMVEEPKVIVAPISEQHAEAIKSNKIADKIRQLTVALTPGQMNVLLSVMKLNNLDNEYEAISLVIKWAAERVNR